MDGSGMQFSSGPFSGTLFGLGRTCLPYIWVCFGLGSRFAKQLRAFLLAGNDGQIQGRSAGIIADTEIGLEWQLVKA